MKSFTISITIATILFTLIIFPSCEKEDDTYIPFSQEQLEWLDINGYWVFEDAYNIIDTIYFESILKTKLYADHPDGHWYYDEVDLKIEDCELIDSYNRFRFTMRSDDYYEIILGYKV
jgi:hypothetical protein